MGPRISVIVPNYEGKEVFPACIRSLLAQDYPDVEVVFVDDSSTDGSYEHAKELFGKRKDVIITRTARNSGFVGACNHALRHCTGEWAIPANNDVTFPKGWLTEMHRTVRWNPMVVGASAFIKSPQDRWLKQSLARREFGTQTLLFTDSFRKLNPSEDQGLVEHPASGCLMIPRKALGDFIFQPDYFAYGEDVNCSWRLRLQGYRIVVNTRAFGITEGGYTRKKVASFNRKATYFGTRNMVLNFLTIYEAKNVLRLWLPFSILQLGAILANPKAAPLRLKAHLWVLFHPREIWRRRRAMQKLRKLPDRDLFRLLSYKVFDPRLATTGRAKLVARAANACMRVYLRVVRLETFDRDDPDAYPDVDADAVRRVEVERTRRVAMKRSAKNHRAAGKRRK